jgi:hypothetical protein
MTIPEGFMEDWLQGVATLSSLGYMKVRLRVAILNPASRVKGI